MADRARLDGSGVTRREADVLAAVADRLTNAEIAARLFVSERTVESHVSSLLRKLGAANRKQLAVIGHGAGTVGASDGLPSSLDLLADPATFVGRRDELGRLRELWRRAVAGHLVVAVVTGEAGMGKSRIVAELAAEVHHEGARVRLGCCFEDLGVPYEPFVHVLAADVASLNDADLRQRVGSSATALARLSSSLAMRLGVVQSSGVADPLVDRAELLTALHVYLSRCAVGAPTLVVLEDLHWSTPTTRAALRHVARSGGTAPLLVVTTTRDVPPDLDDELSLFLGDLCRFPNVEVVGLPALTTDDVAGLLAAIGGGGDPAGLCVETGGNPLFVREWSSAGQTQFGSLRTLVSARYDRLAPGDADVIDLAAVVGAEFDAGVVASAAGIPLDEALESIERAGMAGVVTTEPVRPGRFAFVHALFRALRYEDLPASRRMRLHRRVADVLSRRADNDDVLPDLAHHACAAAPLGDLGRAVEYARRAGMLALRGLGPGEAVTWYRQALTIAERHDSGDRHVVLAIRAELGEAMLFSGDPEGRRTLFAAADDARADGDAHALADVAVSLKPRAIGGGCTDWDSVAVYREAIDALPTEPTTTRALLLAGLAEHLMADDLERSRRLAGEALAMSRALDDPVTVGRVLSKYSAMTTEPWQFVERLAVADELLALGRRLDEPNLTLNGLTQRLVLARESGDLALAENYNAELDAVIRDHPWPYRQLYSRALTASRQYLAGDLVAAEETAAPLLSLAIDAGFEDVSWYAAQILPIRFVQGRIVELVPLLEQADLTLPGLPAYRVVLATALATAGRSDDARNLITDLAADDYRLPHHNWFSGTVQLAELADILDDRPAAATIFERLQPFTGRIAVHGPGVSRPVDQALAQLSLTLDDPQQAATFASRAVEASRQRGTPVFLGRELVLLAAALRRAGHSTPTADLVSEALAIAERTGAQLITQDAIRHHLA